MLGRKSLEKSLAPNGSESPPDARGSVSITVEPAAKKRTAQIVLMGVCVGLAFGLVNFFLPRFIGRRSCEQTHMPSCSTGNYLITCLDDQPSPSPSLERECDSSPWLGTVVRDVKHLTAAERRRIVAGYKRMKDCESLYEPGVSAYDYFVLLHKNATLPSTEVHAGWYFYPWHRAMLQRFTSELRRCTGDHTLQFPYWDWTDRDSTDTLLDLSYLGPAVGNVQHNYQVEEGNFRGAEWKIDPRFASLPSEQETGTIMRAKGNGLQMCVENEGSNQERLYFLDTPDNPPDVDTQSSVGPFINLVDTGPPNSDPQFPPLFLQPSPRNTECTWADLDCDRFYTTANQSRSLRCRHYAATIPTQADYDRCSNLPDYSSMSPSDFGLNDPNPFATSKDYFNSYTTTFRACFEVQLDILS